MSNSTPTNTSLDTLLAKQRATKNGVEMVVLEDGNLSSLTPLKTAIEAYVAAQVQQGKIEELETILSKATDLNVLLLKDRLVDRLAALQK